MNDVIVLFGDSTTALTEGMAVCSEILEHRLLGYAVRVVQGI